MSCISNYDKNVYECVDCGLRDMCKRTTAATTQRQQTINNLKNILIVAIITEYPNGATSQMLINEVVSRYPTLCEKYGLIYVPITIEERNHIFKELSADTDNFSLITKIEVEGNQKIERKYIVATAKAKATASVQTQKLLKHG